MKKLSDSDLITASGKYPERLESPELTDIILANILDLRLAINLLLAEINQEAEVSSGFRPPEVNTKLDGASKKSLHTKGLAVDLLDIDSSIKNAIIKAPHLLAKYRLWMEDPASTPTWCHLDKGKRPDRPVRIFKP